MGTFCGRNLYIEATKEESEIFAKKMSDILHSYPPTNFIGKLKWSFTRNK